MGKQTTGWSDRVRSIAEREYVRPARLSRSRVIIPFGEFKKKLVEAGFPSGHANQVATPLEADKFWKPLGLELCTPKGQSRTVDSVLEFRFVDEADNSSRATGTVVERESASERAFRVTEKLRGLLKKEISAFGGTEGYMRWVRSADEDQA